LIVLDDKTLFKKRHITIQEAGLLERIRQKNEEKNEEEMLI